MINSNDNVKLCNFISTWVRAWGCSHCTRHTTAPCPLCLRRQPWRRRPCGICVVVVRMACWNKVSSLSLSLQRPMWGLVMPDLLALFESYWQLVCQVGGIGWFWCSDFNLFLSFCSAARSGFTSRLNWCRTLQASLLGGVTGLHANCTRCYMVYHSVP